MSEGISRRDLPAVVKRAAELAAVEGDAEEAISEEEVVRIAAELGLSERHVRQALFEGVQEETQLGFLDRQFGTGRIMATRAVPMPPDKARAALEDYLITREYLRVIRRQSATTSYHPADDVVSKVARSVSRSKHCLSSADAVEMTVRELQPGWSHVRLKAIYPNARKVHVGGAAAGIVGIGGLGGAASGVAVSIISGGVLGDPASLALGIATGVGVLGAATATFWTIARNNFRNWRERSLNEANGVLDRLEKGDELKPPAAPWLRKLQLKFKQL